MNAPCFDLLLGHIDDIADNHSKGFSLSASGNPATWQEARAFAVRRDGQLFVYRNLCPHLGLPLEWMPDQFLDREGAYIQCATHGALFRIEDGACVAGPCPGTSLTQIPFRLDGKSIMIDRHSLEDPP